MPLFSHESDTRSATPAAVRTHLAVRFPHLWHASFGQDGEVRYDRRDAQRAGLWPVIIAAFVVVASLSLVFRRDDAPPLVSPIPELHEVAPQLSAEPEAAVGLPYPYAPPGWQQRDPGPLVSRMGVAAVWSGAELLVWGGGSLLADYTSGAIYRPGAVAAPAWSIMTRPTIAGGPVAAAAWTGNDLFVYTTAPSRFDPASNVWTPHDPVPGSFRALAAAASHGGVIVLGNTPDPDGAGSPTLAYALDADGNCCTRLPSPPAELTYATAMWASERLVVIGAGPSDARPRLLSYHPPRGEWTEHDAPDLDPSRGLAAVWADGSLVVVDARLGTATWSFESGWATAAPAPFEDRSCWPRVAAWGSAVFVWYCREASVFEPSSGTWTAVPTPELPSHTISTSCLPVATEESILLWCGNGDGADPLMWEYDPR